MPVLLIVFVTLGCAGRAPTPREAVDINRQGVQHLLAGDRTRAEASFRLALEYDPMFAEAATNLATAAFAEGRLEEALRRYAYVTEIAPDLPVAWCNWGSALATAARSNAAEKKLLEGLRIDPGAMLCREALIDLYAGLGRHREARAHRLRLEALRHPQDPRFPE